MCHDSWNGWQGLYLACVICGAVMFSNEIALSVHMLEHKKQYPHAECGESFNYTAIVAGSSGASGDAQVIRPEDIPSAEAFGTPKIILGETHS